MDVDKGWKQCRIIVYFALMSVSLLGCQSMGPAFQNPTVELLNVTPTQQRGLRQYFDVELAVKNPNSYALNLVGINYVVDLEGLEVLQGSINSIPRIAAYGEESIGVELGVGLLQSLQLISALSKKDNAAIDYSISLKLNTGIPLVGIVPVSKSGTLDASVLGGGK